MTLEQIVTIPAGAEGLDFAGWRPGAEIAAQSFVVRYICRRPNPKAVTRAEIDFYHSLGVAVLLVFEQGAGDWQQGAAKGTAQGQLAASEAALLGFPAGLPVLIAFDTNAVAGDVRAIAYGNAAADELNDAGYDFADYADLDVIRVLANRSKLNWLAGARAWSSTAPLYRPETMPGYELVHVRQTISGSTPNYDNNVVLRPFPAWLPHEVPDHVERPPAPPATQPAPTRGEDMSFIITGRGQAAIIDAGYATGISGSTLGAATIPQFPVADDEWDRLIAVSDAKKAADAKMAQGFPVAYDAAAPPPRYTLTLSGTAQA